MLNSTSCRLVALAMVLTGMVGALSCPRSNAAEDGDPRGVNVEAAGRAEEPAATTWVVLIGVDSYRHVDRLQYCTADVNLFSATLSRRADSEKTRFLRLTEGGEPGLQPTCENIRREVPRFLQRCRSGDTVIVFFSGHGFRDASGGTFLAPIDCKREDLAGTAIAVAWFREKLEDCPASLKLLVLDACHAGGAKGDASGLTSKDLEPSLKDAAGVYTMASCQAKEKSYNWDEKKQGLFTYWLNRGLEGAADYDSDVVITADELHRFVQFQVSSTADRHLGVVQTPDRIVGPGLPAGAQILRLKSERYDATLERVGELIHEQTLCQGIKRIGVVEFSAAGGGGEELRGTIGTLGRAAANTIEQYLVQQARGRYAVVDQRQVTQATRDISLQGLGDREALRQLASRLADLDAVLTGSFLYLPGAERLPLNCKLLHLRGGTVLAAISGVVHVDEGLWPMLGGSADMSHPAHPGPGQPSPVVQLNQAALQPHPNLAPDGPFQVKIRSGGQAKDWIQKEDPNKLYVGVRPDEEYEIVVANRTAQPVFARIFVDGLNVLGARREFPDKAWAWVFPAKTELVLDSWHRPVASANAAEQQFVGGRFVVGEPSRSLAARQGFGEDIGQITVIFYSASAERRVFEPAGTIEGPETRKAYPVPERNYKIGGQLSVITVYYVHEKALQP